MTMMLMTMMMMMTVMIMTMMMMTMMKETYFLSLMIDLVTLKPIQIQKLGLLMPWLKFLKSKFQHTNR